jgi:anti-sigma factor RsiW
MSARWYRVAGLDAFAGGPGVTDYLDEALPARVRAAFDRHLAECPGCTSMLEQWRVVIRLGGRLREDVDAVDPSVREALLDAFRRARTGH